jgi:hypothetical protein
MRNQGVKILIVPLVAFPANVINTFIYIQATFFTETAVNLP